MPGSTTVATKEYFSPAKYGAASPKVVAANQPAPSGGGYYHVGKPYRVAGKTYIPQDNPRYSKVGLASWYGAAFHGRLTANGEIYNVNELTAAHPTLPLPSYVRVTDLENGRSVVVRVNDRGPFVHNRLIDVSAKAAELLGFKQSGTARVRVDYLGPARLDGLDQDMLFASYRGPGMGPVPSRGFTQVAAAPQRQSGIVLASATPEPQLRPGAATAPMLLTPAYTAPAADYDESGDNLGALILRSGLTRSYAEVPRETSAQRAAAELSSHDLTTALTEAAARKAQELAVAKPSTNGTVVQLASFTDGGNARQVAARFSQYGQTQIRAQQFAGRTLQVVLVSLNETSTPKAVIDEAAAQGLSGAFVVSR